VIYALEKRDGKKDESISSFKFATPNYFLQASMKLNVGHFGDVISLSYKFAM